MGGLAVGDLAVVHINYNLYCVVDLFLVAPLLSSNIELWLCFPFSYHAVQDHRILIPV